MQDIITILKQEKDRLGEEIRTVKENSGNYPTGTLQINHNKGILQFYYKDNYIKEQAENGHPPKAHYIRKDDIDLARQLAQRDYEKKLLSYLEKRHAAVEAACHAYETTDLMGIYEKSNKERKKLIKTPYIPDEEYAERWQAVEYVGKEITPDVPEIITLKGERVRSKSEKIIADTFFGCEIPYRYEYPLKIKGVGTIYPDFTVLNKRTRQAYYFEHFGMMSDPDYSNTAIKKINIYSKHGYVFGRNLLYTFESQNNPISMNTLDIIIREYLT